MTCPECSGDCDRDEVDIGVGIQSGPWRCNSCGWYEGWETDAKIALDRDDEMSKQLKKVFDLIDEAKERGIDV